MNGYPRVQSGTTRVHVKLADGRVVERDVPSDVVKKRIVEDNETDARPKEAAE